MSSPNIGTITVPSQEPPLEEQPSPDLGGESVPAEQPGGLDPGPGVTYPPGSEPPEETDAEIDSLPGSHQE